MSEKTLMEMTSLDVRAEFGWRRRLRRATVVSCFLAAAGLRLVALDRYPTPLHQDELSDIYDGYSIATTGADRAGDDWPILVRGMGPGDYHPGLYAYLAAASTWIGGFSVWWGRLPAALAGIATVWFVYATGRRILGDAGGLLALAFITFSPIHIQYSRQAHQGACLVPLFVILCTYTCIRAFDRMRSIRPSIPWSSILLCGFVLGFSTNCYAGQRLTALLFALFALAWIIAHAAAARCRARRVIAVAPAFVLAVVLGASPQLYAVASEPAHFFARGETTFFRFSSGPRWWLETLGTNLLANLDPRYLFLSFGEYHTLSIARLGAVMLPFFYVGLVACCVIPFLRRRLDLALIPAAMAFSLLPGLATEGQPSPMRTSGVWALYPIVGAHGAVVIHQLILHPLWSRARSLVQRRPLPDGRGPVSAVILLAISVNGVWDVQRYLASPAMHARAAQPQFVALGDWVREHGAGYDRIYVAAEGLFGHLYLAAFSGMSSSEYRAAPRDAAVRGLGWEKPTRFGRFFFQAYERAAEDWSASPQTERWLVLAAEGPLAEFGPARLPPLARGD